MENNEARREARLAAAKARRASAPQMTEKTITAGEIVKGDFVVSLDGTATGSTATAVDHRGTRYGIRLGFANGLGATCAPWAPTVVRRPVTAA